MKITSFEEFKDLARRGTFVPVCKEIVADLLTPVSAFLKIAEHADYAFLLESVEGGEHVGRYSFLGKDPFLILRAKDGKTTIDRGGVTKVSEQSCVETLRRLMADFRSPFVPELPRFTGGAVGFIGYEFIHDVEPVVPRPPQDELKTPVMYFLIADQLLTFDRAQQTITVLVNAILDDAESPAAAYENATDEIDRIVSLLEQPSEHTAVGVSDNFPAVDFESNQTKEKFFANVEASKKYITAGDIIQVVGSQRFSAPVTASPVDIYRAVRNVNPSPYMFLLALDGFALVGACANDLFGVGSLRGTDNGNSGLDDSRFFAGDFGKRVSKPFFMVKVDLCND